MKKHLFNIVFLLAGLLGLSGLFLISTPFGLPLAISLLSAVIPGELTVTDYSGRLIDNIHAGSITYQNDRINLTLEEVTVKWQAIALLNRTLSIENLEAKNVIIKQLSGFEEDAGFPLDLSAFSSPSMNVIIEHFNFHVHETDMAGSLVLNEHGLRLRKTTLTHPLLQAEIQANIGPDFNPPIKIIAKEHMTFDGLTPLKAETRLIGNLDKLEGSMIFTEGLDAKLHVLLQNLGPSFSLVASGETLIEDLQSFDSRLTGNMDVNLNLQYQHAEGTGKVSLQSKNSQVNGNLFKMDFSGNILDHIVTWKNNSFSLGEDKLITSGSFGPETLSVNWDIKLARLETSLHSKGTLNRTDDNSVLANFQSFSVNFPDKSTYTLKKPAKLEITQQGVRLHTQSCLTGPNQSSLCAQNENDQSIAFTFKNIPYELFARYYTPRFTITGNLNAKALLTLQGLAFQQLEATGDISPLEIFRGKRMARSLFKTGAGQFAFFVDQHTLKSTGNLKLIETDSFNWTVTVQDWNDLKLANLSSDFKAKMTHWDPLRLFITDTNDFSGEVNMDIQVSGPILTPLYEGSLALSQARLAIPSAGLILQEGQLAITPSTNHHDLTLTGSIKSGEGILKVGGNISLENNWPTLNINLDGDNILLSNTNAAVVKALPRLNIKTKENILDLSGEIVIPEAKLNIKGYQSYISPSPDIIVLDDAPPVRSFIYQVNSRVTLSLGDKVTLKASHLDTGVEGKLHLVKLHDSPVRASGQLNAVNGKYAAYGKKLNLSKAILTFNNTPLDNPALFIEASRTVQVSQLNSTQYMFTDPTPQTQNAMLEATVGLRITGTVQNPKYQFFSSVPMSEADQLSYLLTGAPSSQIGAAQAAFMFAALTETSGMLGVSDTDAARLQNITRTMGIDFNIESGSHVDSTTGERVNDTNLVVGKAIRPRLYVSYTVGLLDPLNVFRVRYQLSRHWAAQSQANSQGDTGGDILYGIESDAFLGMD